jgi:hypothetical protein
MMAATSVASEAASSLWRTSCRSCGDNQNGGLGFIDDFEIGDQALGGQPPHGVQVRFQVVTGMQWDQVDVALGAVAGRDAACELGETVFVDVR